MRSSFTIPTEIVPKPRQTASDKWKQRDCVMRYRKWCDEARLAVTGSPLKYLESSPIALYAFFHVLVADSLPEKQNALLYGRLCKTRYDVDNCIKSCCDALFQDDRGIQIMHGVKLWCEEDAEPRTDLFLLFP